MKQKTYWQIGIDKGEEGTETIDSANNKKTALNLAAEYLDKEIYKNYGIFIDEWVYNIPGGQKQTDNNKVLRLYKDGD